MYLIQTPEELESIERRAQALVRGRANYPDIKFSRSPHDQALFDYGDFGSKELFSIFVSLCNELGEGGFTYLMLEPDPINYFQKLFGWIPAGSFSRNDPFEVFEQFVKNEPANNSADAILYSSRQILVVSDTNAFMAYGTRGSELATLAVFRGGVKLWGNRELDRNSDIFIRPANRKS